MDSTEARCGGVAAGEHMRLKMQGNMRNRVKGQPNHMAGRVLWNNVGLFLSFHAHWVCHVNLLGN